MPLVMPPAYRLRVFRHFDFSTAMMEEYYYLEQKVQVGTIRKRREWQLVVEKRDSPYGTVEMAAKGDLKWARRIAKELNLEVPWA